MDFIYYLSSLGLNILLTHSLFKQCGQTNQFRRLVQIFSKILKILICLWEELLKALVTDKESFSRKITSR